jgi:predicted component of viral defense system (DUF524 family)
MIARDAKGFYIKVLPDGRPALKIKRAVDSTEVTLVPERNYSRTGPLQSVSYEQRPDVAIEIRKGNTTRVYIFDPKYRLATEETAPDSADSEIQGEAEATVEGTSENPRPKKTDIDKMHAYRDAIRDAEGRRVVEYAAILYPGPSKSYGEGVEAIGAYPGTDNELGYALEEVLHRALSV